MVCSADARLVTTPSIRATTLFSLLRDCFTDLLGPSLPIPHLHHHLLLPVTIRATLATLRPRLLVIPVTLCPRRLATLLIHFSAHEPRRRLHLVSQCLVDGRHLALCPLADVHTGQSLPRLLAISCATGKLRIPTGSTALTIQLYLMYLQMSLRPLRSAQIQVRILSPSCHPRRRCKLQRRSIRQRRSDTGVRGI